jgi:hypothetical protein
MMGAKEPILRRRLETLATLLATLIFGLTPLAKAADETDLQAAIAALSSDKFVDRERATKTLIAAGASAIPSVAAIANSGDREASYRSMMVLDRLASSGESAARKPARRALAELAKSDNPQVSRTAAESLRVVTAAAVQQLQQSGGEIEWNHGKLWSISFANRSVGDMTLAALDDVEPIQLNLTRTQVTDDTLARLVDHTQLELLNLMSTKVTDKGMVHLARLTEIRTFSIERTAVTDAGLAHLRGYSKLETLYLGGSQIAGPGLKHLESLPIEYLSFAYSPVDDGIVAHIVPLRTLKTLGLDDTKVTDACVPSLAALENLEVLWLDNTAITDAAIPNLARLAKLKKLHLQNTKLTAKGFADLKTALPSVEITGAPAE